MIEKGKDARLDCEGIKLVLIKVRSAVSGHLGLCSCNGTHPHFGMPVQTPAAIEAKTPLRQHAASDTSFRASQPNTVPVKDGRRIRFRTHFVTDPPWRQEHNVGTLYAMSVVTTQSWAHNVCPRLSAGATTSRSDEGVIITRVI